MRVITGTAKGRHLATVKGRDIRPTADRVKESLFNVLGPRVSGSEFLDLFAGSGGVGIEALSRGARRCVFVELMTPHLKVVEQNLAATGLTERAELLRRDARAAAADLGRRGCRFDLIFVDPPYGKGLVDDALKEITAHRLLKPGGWVICEHHKKDAVLTEVVSQEQAGGLTRFRELVFGETVISLYELGSPV
ncbi:MAG TPA: 16S rRNA (guanine(966)-N(2))-methyltransferase RsmD [Symbiobacteriaceae bacterium]|nr:16S rRNA (guanine(966)-N(2))-methyltransferase RsmD [Symbiobacteriaceae bacterium]